MGGHNGKERKKQIGKKAMSGGVVIFVLLIIFLYLSSTQKVEFNNKQISTATVASCKLIGENYDAINKICVKLDCPLGTQNVNGTCKQNV